MNLILFLAVMILVQSGVFTLLWWLIVTTEGVYLGRWTVTYLYDLFSPKYEHIKGYNSDYETRFLANPIMQRLVPNHAPLVLDVATGTCRLPRALLRHPNFHGLIIGLDISRKMLHMAVGKVAEAMEQNRLYLMHAPAESLPFPDNTFDLVTCLEALEFMVNPRVVVAELVRVTRPGGQLVLTNRRGPEARLMPGKAWPAEKAQVIYEEEFGLLEVAIKSWQMDYDLVWAIKPGQSLPTRRRPLGEVWRCPTCQQVTMQPIESAWECENCKAKVEVGTDGVLEVLVRRQ